MKPVDQIEIYIVEDNFLYSYILESILNECGPFKITTFATGEECIAMLHNNPDVIILDYLLNKGMNGMEIFKEIHAKKPETPVIVLSSQTDQKITDELLKAGVYEYIEKKDKEKALDKLKKAIERAVKVKC